MGTTKYNFYMYEVIDGGAGAIGSVPCELLVFTRGPQLVKHLEGSWGDLVAAFDDESLEDFNNRLGVDEHIIWVVKANTVVERLDLDDFMWLRAGAEATQVSKRERVEELLAKGPEGVTLALDVEALMKALPRATTPLPKSASPTLEWAVPHAQSHIGSAVRLGCTELGSGQSFFWD